MKNMKRLFALLVAIMILVAGVAAYADEDETSTATPDYSITVNNAIEKETYTAYKILDLSVDDPAEPTAYRYTVNSAWTAFAATDAFKDVFTVDDQGYVTSDAASEAAWTAGSALSAFAEAAGKYAADNNIGAAGSVKIAEGATSGTIELPGAGYYVVTSTLGSRAMTATTPANPGVEIIEKNEGDTIVKTVKEDSTGAYGKENDAQVGDTVEFKSVTTIVPRSIKVKIHDKMETGLSFNADSIKIYTNEALTSELAAAQYEILATPDEGDTFTISIKDTFAATATENQTLYVTYTATLTKDAIVTDASGNPVIDPKTNETRVTWGDNTGSEWDTTTTTTHKFSVFKHASGSNDNLADAVFMLKKGAGDSAVVVKLIKIDDNNYRVANGEEDGAVNTFTTVAEGDIVIWGVDADDDYSLVEETAPEGYNKLDAPVDVTVDAGNATRVDVVNNSGNQLPSTGGVGTTIFYVGGSILVIAAVILLVTKRRMSTHD